MVIDRRKLLGGLLSTVMAGRAEAVGPEGRLFVSCRMDAQNNASVACFDRSGREIFATNLPARGHDVTVRSGVAEIVVFARRPGNWFAVVRRSDGEVLRVVQASEGRHFYGHGAFSSDARLLYATENLIATGDGLIGVYDASDGYRRIGELPSGGIGPHDLVLLPGTNTLVIANGGLRTHPDTGREVLNPEDMKPNLALLDVQSGRISTVHELGAGLRSLSIRHLAVRSDRCVGFGCQYQGSEDDAPPLLGVLRPGALPKMLEVEEDALYRLRNYVGSVTFDDGGDYMVATSPQGGSALVWDMARGAVAKSVMVADVCGAASSGAAGFLLSSGNSGLSELTVEGTLSVLSASGWIWDNHACTLVPA